MTDLLLLRLDAPLMSFGAPIVDNRGVIQPFPALSMLAGLVGNALGYDHAEAAALQRLQARLRYAVRQDRPGRRLRDYQTVDLSKPYMSDDRAWTTRGALETRKGGSASSGTHIRLRDYWADAVYTVALALDPPGEVPTLGDVAAALRAPARPLFLGRKACLPAVPLLLGEAQAEGATASEALRAALKAAPLSGRATPQRTDGDGHARFAAWWPSGPGDPQARPVTDRRDWTNQIHVGQRWVAEGTVAVAPAALPESPSP